jgi:4-hydroxybenzoate polyprenyltransferase
MKLLKKTASFIKFEHSLFSLPMLFAGALLAPGQAGLKTLPWGKLLLIILAGTGARAAALGLNRILDRAIDAKNPRTAMRELATGELKLGQAWNVVVIGGLGYLMAAALLGKTCLLLSPLPLIVFALYPLMKRVTWAAHFGVGLGLALAPLGGYVGVTGEIPHSAGPWWLAGFTLAWVSGFDILYATMDEAFDRKEGLHSIPADFGTLPAQDTALMLHALAFFCLAAMRWAAFAGKGSLLWLALIPVGTLLTLEQKSGYSLEKNAAFFKINAWIGVAALLYVAAGVF